MMGNTANGLLGVCPSSVIRGLRFGWTAFKIASCDATLAAKPFDSALLGAIPALTVGQMVGERWVSVTATIPLEDGTPVLNEVVAIMTLVVLGNASVVLEIGTFTGFTTRLIARNLPDAIIHTLDLPLDFDLKTDPLEEIPKDDFHLIKKRQPGREFLNTPEATRIRQHFGDSATWDYTLATGATCFFIDGSHTYEYCKSDSEKCYALCGGKGFFIWHDCDDEHPGVVKLVSDWKQLGRDIRRVKDTRVAYWDGR